MAIIYLAQCTSSGRLKLYVGKTERTLEERRQEHEHDAATGSPRPFHQELIREDLKHWDWRCLEHCSSDEAKELEQDYIKKLGALSIDVLNVVSLGPKREAQRTVRPAGLGSKIGGKNVWKSPSAKKWQMLSGKLMPVVNLTTGIKYQSLSKASRNEKVSRPGIKHSCETGRPTVAGTDMPFSTSTVIRF